MRLISTINVVSEKSNRRHETCFTPTSDTEKNKVKLLKDKLTSKRVTNLESKPCTKSIRTVSVSPPRTTYSKNLTPKNIKNDVTTSSIRSASSPIRTYSPVTSRKLPSKNKIGTFGTEKRKLDITLPKLHTTKQSAKLSTSTELLSPTEVKKVVGSQINMSPLGATYKKSCAIYSSVKNGTNLGKDKGLAIQVGITQRGRELLRPSRIVSTSVPTTPLLKRPVRNRTSTPSPSPSMFSERSKSSSHKSQSASMESLKPLKSFKKESAYVSRSSLVTPKQSRNTTPKAVKEYVSTDTNKKLKKSKKDQLNGEIAKREKKTKSKSNIKSEDRTKIIMKHAPSSENVFHFSQDEIQKQKDAIETHSFFQNLFWKNIPSPPSPSLNTHSWIAERTKLFYKTPSNLTEPTIGALRIYLNHTKPVTESKFKTLDASIVRSRSVSPKSVTWSLDQSFTKQEKPRSFSLPPKIILTQTSRPISPVLARRDAGRVYSATNRKSHEHATQSPLKLVFTETSRPLSPIIHKKTYDRSSENITTFPGKCVLTETCRPISPVVSRKCKKTNEKSQETLKCNKIIFSETSRPISPLVSKKTIKNEKTLEVKRSASASKIIFSETSRPISPIVERKHKLVRQELETGPASKGNQPLKFFFTETSRSVSPYTDQTNEQVYQDVPQSRVHVERNISPSKIILTETSRPISPVIQKRQSSQISIRRDRSESPHIFDYDRSRTISPDTDSRCIVRSYSPTRKVFYADSIEAVSSSTSRERSISPSAKLYFSETSRPVSPLVTKKYESNKFTSAYSSYHNPDEVIAIPTRPRNVNQFEDFLFYEDDASNVSSELLSECRSLKSDIFHSPQRCNKFKELNKFYSTLERMGELERTTSSNELRPRGKREEEIIDYDRWKEVHTRERAEKELESVYTKLKSDQKEKGFLFRPKDVKSFRWKQETDRGLRIKDKSVEDIKTNFEKLGSISNRTIVLPDELIFHRDLYKPLWRGNSVVDLASSMVERRSLSEGRVNTIKKKLLESEKLLTHGIGSRIWSSLSSEQINLLKDQLSEIYSQNGQKKIQIAPLDYTVNVPINIEKTYKPFLTVRRNSNECVHTNQNNADIQLFLSENEKKRLSQSLSREVMNRVSQRQENKASLSLVKGKETRGAIAAADAKINTEVVLPNIFNSAATTEITKNREIRDKINAPKNEVQLPSSESHKLIEKKPKAALVSTDVTNRVTSMSETESGSTDESTKTVIYLGNKDVVQKKVEYFEQVAEERPYTPTIYRAAETQSNNDESPTDTQQNSELDHIEEVCQPRKLVASQSFQDLKELFGEQEQSKLCALNLSPLNTIGVKSESIENLNSKNVVMRMGEVRHLRNKFDFMDDYCSNKLTSSVPRRTRSNPELYRKQIVIPGQVSGEVDTLRRKYEYPWIFSRGRSRVRRGGVVSPIYFRAEDRYMPHINIISKIATLYPKKTVFLSDVRQKSTEELTKLLGCPVGEVERLRKKFDSPDRNISILGHMFTSSPNMHELRDIAPYLTGSWIAHKYPKIEDNTRSLSSPENLQNSYNVSITKQTLVRPKSTSPPRSIIKKSPSPILKTNRASNSENGIRKEKYDPKMHQPVGRYQPPITRIEPVRYKSAWPHAVRPSVTFKGVVF